MSISKKQRVIKILILAQAGLLIGILISRLANMWPITPSNPVYWAWWVVFALASVLTVNGYRDRSLHEMYRPRNISGVPSRESVEIGLASVLMLVCFYAVCASFLTQSNSSLITVLLPVAALFLGAAFHFFRLVLYAQSQGVMFVKGGPILRSECPCAFIWYKRLVLIFGMIFLAFGILCVLVLS
jgi:hypothetical protein